MSMTEAAPESNEHSAGARFAAIKISGPERIEFLQGQLTQDVAELTPERPVFAGWNNPKGRLLAVVWMLEWRDSTWMLLPAELQARVLQRLSMFVLRADVTLEAAAEKVTTRTSINSNKETLSNCFNDFFYSLDTASDAGLLVGEADATGPAELTSEEWRLAHIRSGRPWIWQNTIEEFVPQMVNLDLLDGISFTKGCYVGQEIVARTHNLGRIKRRMYRFSSPQNAAAARGGTVYADGKPAGLIVDAVPTELLAVVRIESLATKLSLDEAGTTELQMLPLPYAVPETI